MVIEIQPIDQPVAVAELVTSEIDLDPAGAVFQVEERGLPLRAKPHDATGDRHTRAWIPHRILVQSERLGGQVRAVEPVGEGGHARRLQTCPLGTARLLGHRPLDLLAHAALPPNRLRYAWMKVSRSPSITRSS